MIRVVLMMEEYTKQWYTFEDVHASKVRHETVMLLMSELCLCYTMSGINNIFKECINSELTG